MERFSQPPPQSPESKPYEEKEEPIKEVYRTANSLQKEIKSNSPVIRSIVEELVEKDPTLESEIQRGIKVKRYQTDAYSAKLVELIKEKRGGSIKEGYRTANSLQKEVESNSRAIKSLVEELVEKAPTLESEIQRGARASGGQKADAYSPRLIRLIQAERGEPIKEGYRTARSLMNDLKIDYRSVKPLVEQLVAQDTTLENEIQRNARIAGGQKVDAYSSRLVELIKTNRGEPIKEGYRTARSLREELKSGDMKPFVEQLVAQDPTLQSEIQRNVRVAAFITDAYSPRLVELIKNKKGEPIKEGYRTASSLQEDVKSGSPTIKSLVEELVAQDPTLENEIQRNARTSTFITDAYSPRLVELIKNKKGEPIKEGYRTAGSLQGEVELNQPAIKSLVEELVAQDPTLESEIQRNVRMTRGKNVDAYSPRLVELIKDGRGEPIKEGYRTASSLVNDLKIGWHGILSIVERLVAQDPTLENEIHRKARIAGGQKVDAYSPRFIELIDTERGEPIKEGYRNANLLANDFKINPHAIKSLVEELVEKDPTLENEIQRNARTERSKMDAYSPKLITLLSAVVLDRNNTKEDKERVLESIEQAKNLEESCEVFFKEISEGKTVDAIEIRKVLSIVGHTEIVDILYRFHPEFKPLRPEYVNGTLAKYLGDILVLRTNFRIEDINVILPYLSNPSFQDSVFEVIKSACLANHNARKLEDKKKNDKEIIFDYLSSIRKEADAHDSKVMLEIADRVEEYYRSILEDFEKPYHLVESLREGRPFPDFNQALNVKEISDKKKILIGDEMGMGKSASAILSKEYIGSKRAAVVVPSNVLATWQGYLSDKVTREGEQVGYFKPGMAPRVLLIEDPKSVEHINSSDYDYVLISQERLTEKYLEKLQSFDFDMLIIDEIHKLKNLTEGERAKNILELAEHINGPDKHLVLLSGTPVPNKIRDVGMLLKLLYPENFTNVGDKELIAGILNGEYDIRNLLVPRMQMKELRESVEMPELTRERLVTSLSDIEKDIYELFLEDDELTASQKITVFRQFIMNPAALEVTPDIESSKIRDNREHLHEVLKTKDKVVLFVNSYIDGIIKGEGNIIEKFNLPSDIEVRIIEGTVSKEERQRIEEELHEASHKILLVVSGQTADVGVDFSAAQEVVIYNDPWTEYDKKQQIARVYRPGLEGDLKVTTSVTEGTIEEGIEKYIELKYRAIQKLLKSVPITEIEKDILRAAERQKGPDVEGDPEIAKEWLNSPQNRLHRFFGITKGIGEENFRKFLLEHGDEYADCYLDMGSRGFQANTARITGTLLDHFIETAEKDNNVRILDIASGPEMLKKHIDDKRKEKVISLDINPLHFTNEGENRVVSSFLKLPIKQGSVDYVNLSLALHYARLNIKEKRFEPLEILKEINGVLKPGGRATISLLYSLEFKDEKKFREVVAELGFKVLEEYTGDVDSGPNYHSRLYVLEKMSEEKRDIETLVKDIGTQTLDGLKEPQSGKESLKNGRKIVSEFTLNGKTFPIIFNEKDGSLHEEQKSILREGNELKDKYGSIKEIPKEDIINGGFLRVYNGKSYRLLKKSEKIGGFVDIR